MNDTLEPKTELTQEEYVARCFAEERQRIARMSEILETASRLAARLPRKSLDHLDINREGFNLYNHTHAEAVAAMAALGAGRWRKNINPVHATCVNYTAQIDGIEVCIWGAGAPGSCRIIEEEEHVPAHTVKRRKLVCTPEPALA